LDNRPFTIFCDIDGTLVKKVHPYQAQKPNHKMKLLPGVLDKISDWDRKGYYIILTTGRKESMRRITEKQLEEVGIFYDQLIMGIGGGKRILINDTKPDDLAPTAFSLTVIRDRGLEGVDMESSKTFNERI